MTTVIKRPVFYKPDFGNDNGYANFDGVDVAAFTAPFSKPQQDAAIVEQSFLPIVARSL
jgi:hypothetical protein